jgi:hypothetical protein
MKITIVFADIIVTLGDVRQYNIHHFTNCEFEPHSWRGTLDTTLCDEVCQLLATDWWFYPGTPGFLQVPVQRQQVYYKDGRYFCL